MDTAEKLKQLATNQKLEGVNFTNDKGIIQKDRSKVTRAEFHFEFDQCIVPIAVFNSSEMQQLKFTLKEK